MGNICNFSSDIIRVLDGVCCRGTMCRSLFQDQEPRTDTYFDFTDQDTRKIEGFLNVLGNFATEELPIPRFIQGREEDDLADLWSFSYGVMLIKPNAYKEKGEGMLILVGCG